MATNALRQAMIALLGLSCFCGTVAAQLVISQGNEVRPQRSVSGFAGSELGRLYRDSVGTGYTSASIKQEVMSRSVARVPGVGRANLGRSLPTKPFANVQRSPTVSPYMNLFREDFDGGSDYNYSTLVRPQLRQQRVNQQLERQSMELSRRLQSISAQSSFQMSGSDDVVPTGHSVGRFYYSHFYPSLNGRR